MNIKLPFWLNNGEVKKIAELFAKWWQWVAMRINYPFSILDVDSCNEKVLNYIAYQRDIERFNGEPLELYRKRVKYAFLNAKDAGSTAGFIRIFERLEIGYVEIVERFDKVNWDVIRIHVSDSQLAKNNELMHLIIRQYGRTCRRYQFEVFTNQPFFIHHGEFSHDYQCYPIKIN
ncbi:phage tail protein [Seminibacterium arietis]|uniref:Phage tail protein n=1 Tax=Seminibacterium arietis TaxID=1173502 RepID=A0ABW3I8P2_9PAST